MQLRYVAGHFTADELHLDLRKICSYSRICFILSAAVGITYNENHGGGWVSCSDGKPDNRYDTLSIDVGSSPSIPDNILSLRCKEDFTNKKGYVTPVKPISTFSH